MSVICQERKEYRMKVKKYCKQLQLQIQQDPVTCA